MKKKLNEVFKITLEVDPRDIEGMHSKPERESKSRFKNENPEAKFVKYVNELNKTSRAYGSLRDLGEELHRVVEESLEDLSLREDRRELNAGINSANENVLRSWRTFLRNLAQYENRFIK